MQLRLVARHPAWIHPRLVRFALARPVLATVSATLVMVALPQPAETALSKLAWISTVDEDGYVHVRSRPSSYYSKIKARADRGSQLEVIRRETANDGYYWYQVRSQQTSKGDVTGWVRGDLVSFSGPIDITTTKEGTGKKKSCASTLKQIEQRLDALPDIRLKASRQQVHGFGEIHSVEKTHSFEKPHSFEKTSQRPTLIQGRRDMQIFAFEGYGETDLMHATVMLNQMAADAIAHCPNLALVRFGVHRTDWHQDYGLLPGNLVRGFVCAPDDGKQSPPRWGEMACL